MAIYFFEITSSNAGLTAGRKDCDFALFPYYTNDKITESFETKRHNIIVQIHKKRKPKNEVYYQNISEK